MLRAAFSTREIHPRNRLSYWLEVATKAYCRHTFTSTSGPAFVGSIEWGSLGDLVVTRFECDPCEVERSERDAGYGDCDDFLVSVLASGRAMHSQSGRSTVNEAGGLVLIDTQKPYTISFARPSGTIVLKVPRQALLARLGNIAPLTARAVDPANPVVRLVAGFLAMLPDQLDGLSGPAALKIAEQALDLVTLAFSVEGSRNGTDLSSARATALTRLKAVIDARLSDPELKPATAAAAAGISVRYANALLSCEGTSVERYTLDRRLERCRRALDDPAQAHRMIGEIAYSWGFCDLSHFGRRFKEKFGLSPTDYRRRAAVPENGARPLGAGQD